MLEAIAFYFFAVLVVAMFLIVVSTSNILYALSALASGMIFVSGFFFVLNAEFLGVVQIAVYTGAVIVMYAFGLMFVDAMSDIKERYQGDLRLSVMVFCVAIVLVGLFSVPIYEQRTIMLEASMMTQDAPNTFEIGRVLFGKYLIAFEIAGVLLLCAFIAGIALGIKPKMRARDELDSSAESIESNSAESLESTKSSAHPAKTTSAHHTTPSKGL